MFDAIRTSRWVRPPETLPDEIPGLVAPVLAEQPSRGDGTLWGESVLVFTGPHRESFAILDLDGRTVGQAGWSKRTCVITDAATAPYWN